MKIVDKLLHFILGVIVLIVALILLCAANPGVRETASGIAQKIGPIYVPPQEEDEAATQQANAGDESEEEPQETKYTVSMDPSLFVYADELEHVVIEATDDNTAPSYNDYNDKRDLSDTLDESAISDYNTGDDEYKKLVEEGDDGLLQLDDYLNQAIKKSDAKLAEPEVTEITDPQEAQTITDTVPLGETGEDAEFDELFYPYYHMLGEKEKKLYKQIYANANALTAEFRPVEECTPKQWIAAWDCVFYDHPELFWMDNTKYYESDYNGSVIKVGLKFYDEIPDVDKAKTRFNSVANEILAGANGLETDYDKEKYIHDTLVNKITYMFNSMDQSAFSSIPNDYTVCCGYAKAFQYLMQKLGVPTYFVIGWGGEMHAWNIIKLDDEYYNVDVTWDDTDPMTYDFFNVTDRKNLMHTRMYQSRYLPACNGTTYSGLENAAPDPKKLGAANDKIYTDIDEYVEDLIGLLDKVYTSKKKTGEVKLVISRELFLEWYSQLFGDQYHDGDDRTAYLTSSDGTSSLTMMFERLDSGDYLITHHVDFGE
ncbi:transglutaminase domain-containing protein [Butyrivibrio sp. XPD2006]|uniref:transglutaminase domain-containing protein n=1 Tax=Butyrivibrio sp. XPD2006 TaxID=1280668 RepID=UPI0003B5FD21|nr:transglutaminase domain-containing protein [Butyrivibrio sp. XPD2006]